MMSSEVASGTWPIQLLKTVQAMHRDVVCKMRVNHEFGMPVGVYLSSVLSALLFITVFQDITEEFTTHNPWKL